jgi:acyl carrier protein
VIDPRTEHILVELISLLQRICECEGHCLTADTPLEDIPGIDSLRLLETVAHLEERFRVEIDTVALDDLRCVRDIVTMIAAAGPVVETARST